MGILVPGENEKREEPQPESFEVLRVIVAAVAGVVGLVLGVLLGWFGGAGLDALLDYPMGKSSGFLSIGHLTSMSVMVVPPLGAVLGTQAGHGMMSGRGSFLAGLIALVVGMVPLIVVSLSLRGLAFPLLLLVPVAVAVGLEISHVAHEPEEADSLEE